VFNTVALFVATWLLSGSRFFSNPSEQLTRIPGY
jgi:hypothetical protein